MNELKNMPTKDLVEELIKREGVKEIDEEFSFPIAKILVIEGSKIKREINEEDIDMNKIREIRKAKKMKLRELSAATGLTIQALSLYERGERGLSLNNAILIARALGVNLEDIAEEVKEVKGVKDR